VPDALVIRVRFADGRYHGAGGWPPSPARLFQALVAGVATGRRIEAADREALAWLEQQDPPIILAPSALRGQGFATFVPNNDLDAVSGIETVAGDPAGYIKSKDGRWEIAASSIRAGKTIRPLLFDAAHPLTYLWPDVTDEPERENLSAIARRLYQLGRGIDPAWAEALLLPAKEVEALIAAHEGPVLRPGASGPDGLAVPDRGSLASLEARHAAFLGRFRTTGSGRATRTTFTNPPKPRFRQVRYEAPPKRLLFELRVPDKGFLAVPAAEAGPLVRRLIERAADRLSAALPAGASQVERLLVGRGATATDLPRRVRVFAVPTLREHVDRAIRRVAIEVPTQCPIDARDIAWAFAGLSPVESPDTGVDGPALVEADDRAMLERYCAMARLWRSETPLALPVARRRIDPAGGERKGGSERAQEEWNATGAVLAALRHAGVQQRPISIRVQREPFAERGTPAEWFAKGTRFSKHALWHVAVRFATSFPGPLILGDGRFCGLGLMRPADEWPGAFAFEIDRGPKIADAEVLADAFRRAVMARIRDEIHTRELPSWFTGHARDGAPLRDGAHRHLAFVADAERPRLLVIAPGIFDRSAGPDAPQDLHNLEGALAGLSLLHAGRNGALHLRQVTIEEDDPLFRPAVCWRTMTAYAPTRHPKRDPEAGIAEDIRLEAMRRGLPRPDVEVLRVDRGPRGDVAAHARLTFARAVSGPILLGRTLHKGGGLFVGERAP
jgi:CRISPR-associated protein Csb2